MCGKGFIYFDWNTIQDLKGYFLKNDEFSQEKWKRFLEIKKKYLIPLSEAHFQDLANSSDDIENEKDLNFLHENFSDTTFLMLLENKNPTIHSEWVIASSSDIKKYSGREMDVYIYYQLSKDNMEAHKINAKMQVNQLMINYPSVPVDIDKVDDKHFLKKYLMINNGFADPSMFINIARDFNENINNAAFIQSFISTIRAFEVYDHPVMTAFPNELKKLCHEYAVALMEWIKIKKAILTKSDKEKTIQFLKIHFKFIGQNYDQLAPIDKIQTVYSLLNFTDPQGYCGENFKDQKGKRPSNSFRDSFHLVCAQNSQYLVTEDKKLGSVEHLK